MPQPNRVFSLGAILYLSSLALLSPRMTVAQQQQSQQFSGGGHLTYTVTQSGGSCGMYGQGSYQSANYSNLVYVDWNGNQNALGGGGSYISSPGGQYCPPNGPEPPNGIIYTGATSAASYSITAMPGASTLSASISYPQCQITESGYLPNTNAYPPSNARMDISSDCPGATLFYTTDGSQPTEASNYCGSSCGIYTGTSAVRIIAVQMTPSGSTPGVAVQNGQDSASNFKTVLASTQTQSQPFSSSYNTPLPDYCSTAGCTTQGVEGIPTAIDFLGSGSLSFPSASSRGGTTAANLAFTTENLQGTYNGQPNDPSAPNGTQVLWPYNTGDGCDNCTSMVQDFYIWPQNTSSVSAANVQNWEMDLEGWNSTDHYWLGASLQCSAADGGWEYNGQGPPGWTLLNDANGHTLNHDCSLPYGTIPNGIGVNDTQFTVSPAASRSTVEPGMIVMVDNEEIMCTAVSGNTCTNTVRAYGLTTQSAHPSDAQWMGSVHVQYHVTLPGDGNVYIDYLNLNYYPGLNGSSALNHYDFRQIYGTQQVNGIQVSKLSVPHTTLSLTYPDRVFDQKQIDVAPVNGSPNQVSPFTVGEFIDQDNVTASYGIMGATVIGPY